MRYADQNFCYRLLEQAASRIDEAGVGITEKLMHISDLFKSLERNPKLLFAKMRKACNKWKQGGGMYQQVTIAGRQDRCLYAPKAERQNRTIRPGR